MTIRKLLLAFVCAGLPISYASAQEYHPDFSCSADLSNNSVATMLCKNSDAAKSELQFDQAYYALRQQVGKPGWKDLKAQAISDQDASGNCVDPASGQASPSCYISHMNDLTATYRGRLSGDALEEATRPIDQHIQLQKRLIDLGYLPTGSVADGVYGEGTRTAIETWQRVTHRPSVDGFLSNDDAVALQQNGSNPQSPQKPTPPTIDAAPAPPSDNHAGEMSIYSMCGGYPKTLNAVGFDDPYSIEGKCFIIRINSIIGQKQWIDSSTILLINQISTSINGLGYNPNTVYTTIVHDPNGHINYGELAVVMGAPPTKYQSASGEEVVAPWVNVVKYLGNSYFPGSGELGEPLKGHIESAEFPDNLSDDVSYIYSKLSIRCHMVQPDGKFFYARNCVLLNQEGDQRTDFLNSAKKSLMNSFYSRDMFHADSNGYTVFFYTFEHGDKPPAEDPNRMCEKTNWLGQVKLKKCAPRHANH
ncbi:peptidoglycan-binding protein [Komagataeibacter sp. FNDCF1]|uniref:peptidoglycan-binding domain-containing protein n=1 Tax=Komagataeibacter sp. FNDCF1 TaxID=2878681 RepID=UPI001E2AC074|nr:peptidoglycan-binding protein [Komagataeibacter sp. FNDCF1]MCE2563387.1 peptidoglycan-binding protein [Komagataeibacter sp. FNDCF1]